MVALRQQEAPYGRAVWHCRYRCLLPGRPCCDFVLKETEYACVRARCKRRSAKSAILPRAIRHLTPPPVGFSVAVILRASSPASPWSSPRRAALTTG